MNDVRPTTRDAWPSRRFGGLMAVNEVAIELTQGTLHAVLGPNGAGKTTLINLLSGELAASGGSIRYKGEDITRLRPTGARASASAAASRRPNISRVHGVRECRLAAQSRVPRALHVASDAAALRAGASRPRSGALDAAGLAARGERGCLDAVARRAAAARDRDGARDCARGTAARRAAGRMGAEEAAADGRAAEEDHSRIMRCCWSSTTWMRCSPSPTGSL